MELRDMMRAATATLDVDVDGLGPEGLERTLAFAQDLHDNLERWLWDAMTEVKNIDRAREWYLRNRNPENPALERALESLNREQQAIWDQEPLVEEMAKSLAPLVRECGERLEAWRGLVAVGSG